MKIIVALALTIVSLNAFPAFADDGVAAHDAAVVEFEADSDYAKVDDTIFCTVAMVDWRGHIMRRYYGVRSLRSFRCERPMWNCRHDLARHRHGRGHQRMRCVEIRH